MTRKKSNVKALALAVTCAILAGGGIGLEPVYAAADDVTYDSAGSTLKYEVASTSGGSTTPTEIKKLVVNGVTIGSANGEITASKIVGTGTDPSVEINGVKIGAVSDGSVTMHTIGSAITISGTSTAMYDVNIGNNLTVKGQIIDSNDVSKAVSVADLADAVGQVETNRINIINNKNDIAGLKTKTTGISYSTATGTIVDGVQLKEKGISAAGGAFTVNGTDGETVVSGIGGKTTINHSSIVIEDTTSSKHVIITNENVNASHSVQAKIIDSNTTARMADGNVVAKNGLYVGAADITAPTKDNSKFSVDGTTGDTAVGGNLSVAGTTTFTGETTFDSGIKTNTISGKNPGDAVTVNGNIITTDKKFNGVELNGGNVKATDITAAGALKGQTLGIGAANTEFVVDANGNITKVTSITADQNKLSTIGGVKLEGKKVTADNLEIDNKITTKDLKVNGSFEVGDFTTNNLKVNNTLTVGIDTTLTDGKLVLGTDAQHTLTKEKLKSINDTINNNGEIETTKATIGVNTTIDSTGIRSNSVTADTGTIGGITLNSNNISGVTMVTAGEFNVNGNNFLNSTGITASKGKIGEVTIENKEVKADKFTAGASSLAAGNLEIDHQNSWTNTGIQANDIKAGSATIGTNTKIDSTGIVTNKVTLGDMTITDGNISRTNGVTINGVELKTNAVTASGGFTVDTQNKLDATGLTAKAGTFADSVTIGSSSTNQTKVEQGKITVKGTAGRSTAAETETTIDGGVITTDTLNVQRIELGEKLVDTTGSTITDSSIYLDHDGSFGAAKGAFQIDKDGQVKNNITVSGADASETTFTSSKTGITAKYRKGTGTATSGLTIEDNHAALNASGGVALDLKDKTATLGIGTDSLTTYTSDTIESKVGTTTVTTKSGGTTFGDGTANNTLINGSSITSTKDGTFTTINGSSVRSYNSATGAGHLNGATLNLWKDSDNATYMTAGGATFTKDGKTTIISGDTITTGTLNVKDIVLGGTMYDATGHPLDGKLSIGNDGHLRAANGNFDVKDDGTFKNTVGNTTLQTDTTGASMKFDNNATTGGIKSEVAVADDSAKISAGASSIEVKNDGITNNGVTTFNGTTGTTTKIDGGTITTNHLITDKLTITGSGNAEGLDPSDPDYRGSIAFGGNGSITSNIKDGTKEVTFKTDKTGTFTEAKDGSNVTTNTVNAQGNTNVVTDGTNTSTATQTATSIGGVVTNGTVKMSQELTADGVKFEQTGYDEVNIAKGDVTVKNNRNTATPNQEVHLSDLGSLNNLDGELAARDEYTDNKTAVGAINAEAGIRREEVTRLDGRINDVNDRVNKVGAMAAAIASLKSIGYDPQAPSEFSIGLGQYKGETGVAMGFFHYPNKNFMINVSLSTAGGETMGGIGATWRFGHKSPQKLLEEQREAQAKKELAAAEKYQAAAKLAKEAQERAEYAAKLARQAQVSADNAKAAADATQAKHFG
ncbi:YadA-like family protein [Phascolarctobacterium succinatutens]|uniref:YadA-like family protein n=1 Tax=Phascolarctobacterium succinatutens TaxID=626940 RepID=UPI003FD8F12B